jgi:TfoX/Sxy family transcriptional regulator of competence genes
VYGGATTPVLSFGLRYLITIVSFPFYSQPPDRSSNMTPEESLSVAVRGHLSGAGVMSEVKMFGGIGFMLNGNLVAAVSKRGLLLRVGKDRSRDALAWPGARPMEMRGRTMEGYVYIDPPVPTNDVLKGWLDEAVAFVKTLPVKATGAKPKRPRRPTGLSM